MTLGLLGLKKDIDKLFLLEDECDNDKYNDFSFFNI